MKHTVGYISIFFLDGHYYLLICFFMLSQIAEKAKFTKNHRLLPIRKADDLNESGFFLTWFEIGQTSIAISRSLIILRASGCFVIEYPCQILVAFNSMASIMLKSA